MYYERFLSKKFLTHATQGVTSRGERTICGKIFSKYAKNEQIQVEKYKERHFLEIKNCSAKNHTGLARGGHWGIGGGGYDYFSPPEALAHGKCSYSSPLRWGIEGISGIHIHMHVGTKVIVKKKHKQ